VFERPRAGRRAVLVSLDIGAPGTAGHGEFSELVVSAGAEAAVWIGGSRRSPDPRYFVGGGKAAEIRDAVAEHAADLVVVNHPLSPSQERNLERLAGARVLDRTGLILDIFAQRARSFEGKLQVELAQLRHLSTRLVRGWSHLERQKGGIGLRGPGETQLETDRRLIGKRIQRLTARLERVGRQREQGRRARRQASVPTVALVGYTNAGKSTLFNALTGSGAYTADQLFATLDPTLRRVELDGGGAVVLADTVGFIRDLPPDLVAAFRATLEETLEADLLLHVVDAADPNHRERMQEVDAVLREIGAAGVPRLTVYNKIDLAGGAPVLARDGQGLPESVRLSATAPSGLDLLRQGLLEYFQGEIVHARLRLPLAATRARARLFDLGAVCSESVDENGWLLEVALPRRVYASFCREEGLEAEPPVGRQLAAPMHAQ